MRVRLTREAREPKPLYQGHIHFHFPSAEVPFPFPQSERRQTPDEIARIIIGQNVERDDDQPPPKPSDTPQ